MKLQSVSKIAVADIFLVSQAWVILFIWNTLILRGF